jgi:hypothetical protein
MAIGCDTKEQDMLKKTPSATHNCTFTDGKVRAKIMSLNVLKEIIQNYFTM